MASWLWSCGPSAVPAQSQQDRVAWLTGPRTWQQRGGEGGRLGSRWGGCMPPGQPIGSCGAVPGTLLAVQGREGGHCPRGYVPPWRMAACACHMQHQHSLLPPPSRPPRHTPSLHHAAPTHPPVLRIPLPSTLTAAMALHLVPPLPLPCPPGGFDGCGLWYACDDKWVEQKTPSPPPSPVSGRCC